MAHQAPRPNRFRACGFEPELRCLAEQAVRAERRAVVAAEPACANRQQLGQPAQAERDRRAADPLQSPHLTRVWAFVFVGVLCKLAPLILSEDCI